MTLARRDLRNDPAALEGLEGPDDLRVSESAASRLSRWLLAAPAERIPAASAIPVWVAALVVHDGATLGHVTDAAAVVAGLVTLAGALAAGWIGEHRASKSEHPRLAGAELAGATAAVGAWFIAAVAAGPLAGPAYGLTLLYGLGVAVGCAWLRRHEAVVAARARRDAEAARAEEGRQWRAELAPALGLRGSHRRIERNTTGETWTIDTHGTGNLASRVPCDYVAERLAGILKTRKSRVEVFPDSTWPDRLLILIRDRDPWAAPMLHPMIAEVSPWAKFIPAAPTIRKPLAIGATPETGAPLQLEFFNDDGAAHIGILSESRGGKSNLLCAASAAITACPDAALLQINLAKPQTDQAWAPAAAVTVARNPDLAVAVLTFACAVILLRSSGQTSHPGSDVHQPAPGAPAYIVKFDEIDTVNGLNGGPQLLWFITSKGGSEAVGAVLAGQRATAAYFGGANIRACIRTAVAGKTTSGNELNHLIGDEAVIPDMRAYGEGAPGVFLITQRSGGAWSRGRTFFMTKDPRTWRRLAEANAAARGPFALDDYLAPLAGAWEAIQAGDAAPAIARTLAAVPDLPAEVRLPEDFADSATALASAAPAAPAGPAPVSAARQAIADVRASLTTVPRFAPPAAPAEAPAGRIMRDLPSPELQARLRELLARPVGVTLRKAGEELGVSHTTVHNQLKKWQHEEIVLFDTTAKAWRSWGAPTRPPYLRVVPDDAPGAPAGELDEDLEAVEDDDDQDQDQTAEDQQGWPRPGWPPAPAAGEDAR
jgi:hypothetical protein